MLESSLDVALANRRLCKLVVKAAYVRRQAETESQADRGKGGEDPTRSTQIDASSLLLLLLLTRQATWGGGREGRQHQSNHSRIPICKDSLLQPIDAADDVNVDVAAAARSTLCQLRSQIDAADDASCWFATWSNHTWSTHTHTGTSYR